MSGFKYKGTDITNLFDEQNGTISGINFSPFPNFKTTNNVNEKYKTNEIKLLGESFKTANQDILTQARNFKVTKSSRNTDGELTMPAWANAVKIRVTGVKGDIGSTGQVGEVGDGGGRGDNGQVGEVGDKGAKGGKGKNHQFKGKGLNCNEQQSFGGDGGDGGDGGAGGPGGAGGYGGAGGDGGDGGFGGEGGDGGVNIFEDVFTVLNNNTVFNFEAGNNEDFTTLVAQVNEEEKLRITLQKGAKGHTGLKGFKGVKGAKGVPGLKGLKGYPGKGGRTGGDGGFGNHKYNVGAAREECNAGGNGGKGADGEDGAANTATFSAIPGEGKPKAAKGRAPDNSLKGQKGATRAINTKGTNTAGQTNISGLNFTSIQSTPSVELSFFVVDDTEN